MINNIVLSGGTTMIPGFAQRIKKTLPHHFENDINFSNHQVIAESNRFISTWIGASMVACNLNKNNNIELPCGECDV